VCFREKEEARVFVRVHKSFKKDAVLWELLDSPKFDWLTPKHFKAAKGFMDVSHFVPSVHNYTHAYFNERDPFSQEILITGIHNLADF
jgi:hypothetical protein